MKTRTIIIGLLAIAATIAAIMTGIFPALASAPRWAAPTATVKASTGSLVFTMTNDKGATYRANLTDVNDLDAGTDYDQTTTSATITFPGLIAGSAYQVRFAAIDAGHTSSGWTAERWVFTTAAPGSQGPAGTNGTNGTDGTDGTNGTDGKPGLEAVTSAANYAAISPPATTGGTKQDTIVDCPAGQVALSGGYGLADTQAANLKVVYNDKPSGWGSGGTDPATGWQVTLLNDGTPVSGYVWVVCGELDGASS